MSTSKKCDDVNEILNTNKPLNVPSHGQLPKWLDDIADNIVHRANLQSNAGTNDRFYHIVDLNRLKDSSDIPSTIVVSDDVILEKANTRARYNYNSAKFGRRSSLAAQMYARHTPRHLTLSKFDYIVPQLEGNIDFQSLYKDMKQTELEKSWRSLNTFEKTHKGRLDSAKHEAYENMSKFQLETSECYSPSMLENRTPVRSQSELSHYVPFYVYSNIRKATEPDILNPRNLTIKSKSSEEIYDYTMPNTHYQSHNRDQSSYKEHSNIERQLSEYKLRVDQENRLREKIINELLTENERITERLKQRHCKKTLGSSNFGDPPVQKNTCSSSKPEDEFMEVDAEFVIPELPSGQILKINILSTWGDKHYVGLNGIEIFSTNGNIVSIKNIQASPPDVNVLPENNNDPRIVQNLLDGVNRTQDDVHLWLAPFEEGLNHNITVEFTSHTTIAMMRIWNYNKSRIHSYRGVRHAVISLDDVEIFNGEIAKACGGMLGGVDAFGDTILFTTDGDILELISKNDQSYSMLSTTLKPDSPITLERPPTVATLENRPYTGIPLQRSFSDQLLHDQILLGANRIDIVLLANWGYLNVIGLTGLEVVGMSDNIVSLREDNIQCNTANKNTSLKALTNGVNVTTDTTNMWWVPHRLGQKVIVTIQFNRFSYISGLRIWNYNGSTEDTYAGVQAIKILLDGKQLINPARKDEVFLLRRAPGNTHYDFVQDIRFTDCTNGEKQGNSSSLNSSFHSLSLYRNEMPEGFVFQFIIFSTWGDQYYCGLNEIEIYNEYGKKIILEEQNICAYPESINVLPGVNGDIRTPDKLIDGIMVDDEGAHSWLAPIIPTCLNRIYIVLDAPTTISLIKMWNYSKTPSRGVREFGVLVDDLLIYNGILDKYVNRKGIPMHRSIIFTDDKKTLEREIHSYIRQSSHRQEVVLLDENRTTTVGSLPNPDQALRPFTSVSPFENGYLTH